MAKVKPPGYYISWYHFVADLPTQQNVNIYDFITKNSYWNSSSKKLNAIITVPANAVISAKDIKRAKIDDNGKPTVSGPDAAIYIPPTTKFGGGGFRTYDRVTIVNKGKIIGPYAYRDYGGDDSSFTPPAERKDGDDNITDEVNKVSLSVKAAGGGGGGASNQYAGAGGGGGGSGGSRSNSRVSVTPGVEVTATIGSGGSAGGDDVVGGTGGNSSFSQGGSSLISATGGKGGEDGDHNGSFERCWFWGWPSVFCATVYREGTGGKGGAGGNPGGVAGSSGTGGPEATERSGSAPRGAGGAGGSKDGHASGGSGGNANKTNKGANATKGEDGGTRYDYTRRELYGPAIVVRHSNVFIDNNNGKIIGGYPNIENQKQTKWALYGNNNVKPSEGRLPLPQTNFVGEATAAEI